MNKEKIQFLHKLASFIEIDMPMQEAFSISMRGCKNQNLKSALQRAQQKLIDGATLADSLSTCPGIWDYLTVSTIWSGEVSGHLHEHIRESAEFLSAKQEFFKKITTALLYPFAISLMSGILITFLIFYIYPKIIPIFLGLRIELPLSTKIVLAAQNFLQKYWYGIFVIIGLCISVIIGIKNSPKMRTKLLNRLTAIPFVGVCIRQYQFAIIAKHIGILSKSEIGFLRAVEVAKEITYLTTLQQGLEDAHYSVQQGKQVSETFTSIQVFPQFWIDFLVIGERTSKLDSMFMKISEIHEKDLEQYIMRISKLLEPSLMIVCGGIVLFIALSIITPMYTITQYVQ